MDPFGMTPEQYAAGAAWATFVVLLLTALFAVWQLREARTLRREHSRPYVVLSLDIQQRVMLMFNVENVGQRPAYNVTISFDQPPQSTLKDIENLRILREPIPTMPPRQVFHAYWESAFTVFDAKEPYPYPMHYRASVTYGDAQGHSYGPEEYVLDFRVFEGQAVAPKGLSALVTAVEAIQKQQKGWQQRGLVVRVRDEDRARRRQDRPVILLKGMREWDKRGLRGLVGYHVDRFRRRHGLFLQGWPRPDRKKRP